MTAGEKVLRVGTTTPVTQVDGRLAHDAATHLVLAQVFEAPYAQAGPDGPIEPLVFADRLRAEEGPGGRPAWSGAVREGLVFSDGTPVGPDHVVESLRDVPPVRAEAEVSRRGNRVLFSLSRPIAAYELQLAKRWCHVVLHRGGDILGTGPFTWGEPRSGDLVRLVRNVRHRNPVPLDAIEFRVYPPDQDGRHEALVDAVERGDVDLTMALPREEIGRLVNVRKLFQPGNSTAMLFFNTERPPFDRREPRVASAHAVDRYAIARASYPDSPGLSARGLLPPNMGSVADGIRHDPRRAGELLAAAGIASPRRLRLIVVWGPRPYMPRPALIVEHLGRAFAPLGLELEPIYTRDPGDYFEWLRGGDYDLVLGGWIADSDDPADFLDAVLGREFVPTRDRPTAVTANLARWRDDETERLIQAHRRDPSPSALEALLGRVARELPLLPLMYGPRVIVHSRRVKRFSAQPAYVPSLARVDLT